jgi:hypothetical protein
VVAGAPPPGGGESRFGEGGAVAGGDLFEQLQLGHDPCFGVGEVVAVHTAGGNADAGEVVALGGGGGEVAGFLDGLGEGVVAADAFGAAVVDVPAGQGGDVDPDRCALPVT